jgi:aminopeptidase-like protein
MLSRAPMNCLDSDIPGTSPASLAPTVERTLLDGLFDELFPLPRSITGEGLRQSFAILSREMPLTMETVPTGTQVFDWEVPPEWRLKKARLIGPDGVVYCDAARCNLDVVNYSMSVDRLMSLEDLQPHLHSVPRLPTAVPYVTSYYKRTWGFCLSDHVRRALPRGTYHAQIESEFVQGGVPLGQAVLPGESEREILITSYLCHPSLANNELSGPLAAVALYRRLQQWPRRRFTYRFVIHPETIGSLCYLHRWGEHLRNHLVTGMVLTCVGGPEPRLSYKLSRRGDTLLDGLVKSRSDELAVREFDPTGGSDERQHCSPGFNLPVGQFARTVYGQYDGYHNSLDTKEFMGIDRVCESAAGLESVLRDLDLAGEFVNLSPYGEPQLGRRDLYPTMNAAATWQTSNDTLVDSRTFLNRLLTVLNWSDGEHTMLEIATKAGITLRDLRPVVERLEASGLLKFVPRLPLYRRIPQ